MKCCNAYESKHMRDVTGITLRPGKFILTDKAVEFCKFSSKDFIMDLGSGMGATVNYLHEKHGIKAVGVDPSEKLIDIGVSKYKNINLVKGKGEQIPFPDESFNGVFAECTMSLMDDANLVIEEVSRVLKKDGWFVITDVYAKNPQFTNKLNALSVNSCMRGLHNLELLQESLVKGGFKIMFLEDCSDMLKELMVKVIFSYGSMSVFWNKTTECSLDGQEFHKILKLCKPGYFIMIARKGDGNFE
ncbi:DVU_1556 family methyltransferase [Clostridium magnum]|uniref:Putative methyltransferase YcgJ n=1 Tax=Clostridium magnum DSM 2767 TaxID=1121326 RepID=A0A162R6U2_9CLOT|nr:class I SAM-dependent methyltransferase [Clostridium magnum]KZL89520.1 putative methyltransferase YcgJ [Clostridium magnum DSM 2767]SHH71189.1 Ubiquinone/menaquinone biosynthesis C-methylase UbiE [Clostridium magnum DSM 2767]